MKLVTAQELRASKREEGTLLADVIAIINARLRERHGLGKATALIGFAGGTITFSLLSEGERDAITESLRLAGFRVIAGPAPKTIIVSWNGNEDEQD